jgi:molybdopterin synthase catalytic subunit
VAAGFNNAPSKDKTIVFFPYRAHTHNRMDKRSIPIWQKEIMTPREKWLNDYLK